MAKSGVEHGENSRTGRRSVPAKEPGGIKNTVAGRMPDFVIVGAMKSGTTSLFRYLSRHPDVFLCRPKEPQFFSRDHVYDRGLKWYGSLFREARADQVCGEASTCYSRWPQYPKAAERLGECLPDARLIYIMRHPVERAYSHYRHEMERRISRRDGPVIPFETALKEIPEIADAGRYAMQIERLRRFFPYEQLLLLTLDELEGAPQETLGRLQKYLGLRAVALLQEGSIQANQSGGWLGYENLVRFAGWVRSRPCVRPFIDSLPQRLRHYLGRRLLLGRLAHSLSRHAARRALRRLDPLKAATRAELVHVYGEENRKLERLLDRELPEWSR